MTLHYTTSPHLRGKDTTARLMRDVILALLPALIVGIALQGVRALLVTLISVAAAVAAEGLYRLFTKQYQTIADGSAVLTGLLLAMLESSYAKELGDCGMRHGIYPLCHLCMLDIC